MTDRPLAWVGSSLSDVRDFPADARRAVGYQLRRIQQGLMPSDWKPMSSVGAGVVEIRIQTRLQHRVIYIATFRDAIYVLHAFAKKTRKTRASDLSAARAGLKELEARHRSGKE